MNPDEAPKAYGKAQVSEVVSFDSFVQHIANHNGVFSRGTVKGVVSDMCACLVECLLRGEKVQFGELGSFWISLGCEGAESLTKFTSQNITSVKIIFTPGPDFENLLSKASFNFVPSRIAQAATLKAEKNNEGIVDLEAAKAAKRKQAAGSDEQLPDNESNGGTTPESGGNTGGGTDGDSIG